jgi:hypothetical protein
MATAPDRKIVYLRGLRRCQNASMGQSILVTAEGLQVFAARSGKHATLVGGVAAAPPRVSAPGQLTAGAVQAAHAAVAATGAAMGARIGSLSQAAQVTAARYEITEQSNTEKLVGLRWV